MPDVLIISPSSWFGFAGTAIAQPLLAVGLAVLCALVLTAVLLRKDMKQWFSPAASESRGISDNYRRIAEASGEVFFEFDPKSRAITWTSDLGAGFLGYTPGELTFHENALLSLVHRSDQPAMKTAWADLRTMRRLDMGVRLLKKNGQWCWVHIIAVPESGNGGHLAKVVGVIRNTQELHETQEALAEAKRMETVGQIAGGIAHEFNNHLTPVHGYIELALDDLPPGHPSRDGLRTALERVEYCSDLVSQIQAYGRKTVLLPRPIDVVRVLPSIVRVALSAVQEKTGMVCMEEQWPSSLPIAWIDQLQLQQAMTHIIRNAMQAMPDGGHLTVRAEQIYCDKSITNEHPGAHPGDFIRIGVTDTGTGISPENLERVLDPFYTTHEPGGGRGMGLKMVQGIVAQHGGWMEITSSHGKGTHVRLSFPIRAPRVEEQGTEPTQADADGTMAVLPAAPLGRLLVADDEDFIRDIIARVFEMEGWNVSHAVDHTQVWESLQRGDDYDMIILDLTMPGPSAEQTVGKIRRERPGTKILIISGFARDARVDRMIKLGNADFLSKPFSPKDIVSRVDRMLSPEHTLTA